MKSESEVLLALICYVFDEQEEAEITLEECLKAFAKAVRRETVRTVCEALEEDEEEDAGLNPVGCAVPSAPRNDGDGVPYGETEERCAGDGVPYGSEDIGGGLRALHEAPLREAPMIREAEGQPTEELAWKEKMRRAAEEKRRVWLRLKAYREANGLGCLQKLAAACGSGITDDELRDLLVDTKSAGVRVYRAIDKGLDKLERGGERA